MISVAIITYNHEKYIKHALESVLSQSIDKKDLEIVLGDDGSTDSTLSIVREYANKYPFIKVRSHENYGISKNVYDVFKNCKGDYIAVLEGDDYWLDNDKLKKQINQLIENNCIGAFSNCLIVDENNNPTGDLLHKKWKNRVVGKKDVEKYQTDLLMPSSLFFKNIFLSSQDDYSIIRDASRFGGCHSGMINLLGSLGKLYYSSECLTVWRKVLSGGSNYSSRRDTSLQNHLDQLRKYYKYKKTFKMNYDKPIKKNYYCCQRSLNDELVDCVGRKKAFSVLIYSFFHSLLHLFKRK